MKSRKSNKGKKDKCMDVGEEAALFGIQGEKQLWDDVSGAQGGPLTAQGNLYSFGREERTPEVSEPWHLRRHQSWWPGSGTAEANRGHMSQKAGLRAKALRGELEPVPRAEDCVSPEFLLVNVSGQEPDSCFRDPM